MVRSQPGQTVPGNPILKKPFTKRAGGVAQGVGPEFKPLVPPYHPKEIRNHDK
jgi:hypothetical protein